MSFNSPFFHFFDTINNDVDYFNRMLDNSYPEKRQRLIGGNEAPKASDRQLAKANVGTDIDPFGPLDNWFDNDLSLFPTNFASSTAVAVPVDILDHEKNYELKITVPGVKSKKDIDLEYHKNKNQIIVSGEVPSTATEENKQKIKVKERASGKFKRVIALPDYPPIDADNIKADYSSGVLTLTVPKLKPKKGEKDHVQKIEISSEESWGN
ncbi:hypothetical protein NCAS_0A10710 [Naumovozyma castellii]|uniref:SHSP domain-containing protein n=1 Tax=Naumovozyma castellii TaxID=27288 RepID=G0V831_NAUCA|nr:hypothetical protein NCAS_0A10710 [Naumovozyma castellii CBS 4309]CCC67629.1 hypothetical protein NCAS_0A10710 [Naumovozyma castellii CBS 4309]